MFAETAGGVTVATTRKLVADGQLDPDAETVLLITGDGLKTLDAVAGQVGPTATVPSSSKAVPRGARGTWTLSLRRRSSATSGPTGRRAAGRRG